MIHKRIVEMTQGVRKYIFLKGAIGIIISISYIIQAIFLGKVIAQMYQGSALLAMKNNLIVLVSMLLLRIILVWFNQLYGKWIVAKVKNYLRMRAYKKLMKLGPGYMIHNRTGEIESTIVAGVDYLEGYLTLYIPQILVCIMGSGAMVIYIFSIKFVLGMISLISVLASLFAPMLFVSVLKRFTKEHWSSYMDLNAEFVDAVQGMITLKAFNASQRIGKFLKAKMHILFQKTMKSLRFNLLDVGIAGFSASVGSAFTLGLAAYYTAKGELAIEKLPTLLFLTSEVFRPITELSIYFHAGFMGITSTDGILKLFDEEEFVINKKDNEYNHLKSPIELKFNSISFNYPKSKKTVLKDMSFKIKKLEKIAIVGESGSGKTTLINLLLRFYDPDKGKIYYNNIDIKDIPLEALRKQVAVVSQDTYLFNGTIMENLKLAKEDASMDELISACKAAKIHDFISGMKDGYLTFVGEMGLNLSGGQRQRIAIARALLKNAPLIILDEATSSVDIENEKAIQESLDILLKNKTSITIAHRLSTIKNVDRILVLKDGEIVEEGKHKELMKNKKEYYKLILAQREVM